MATFMTVLRCGLMVALCVAQNGAPVDSDERERIRRTVCPQNGGELRYGDHYLPKQVLYTGRTDGNLRNLTWGNKGAWPEDFTFVYYDNDALDETMRHFSRMLRGLVGSSDVYEAYNMLRPWAYRADLWRYCILWACGGVYVDSKLAIAEPFHDFLWKMGFNPNALAETQEPQLYSCRDDLASESMVADVAVDKFSCIWQGLLISEPYNPALLTTIRWVIDKIQKRWYPPLDDFEMPWLFLTGPGAIALATQLEDPSWENHVKLRCRMTYTPKTQLHEPLKNPHLVGDWHLLPGANYSVYDADMGHSSFIADAGLHETQRTNDYGKLYKTHLVYMDDEFNETFASIFRKPRVAKRRVARWGHYGPFAGHGLHYPHPNEHALL